jgi:UDP-GlcNAc:undecaprenyl-phosphate GlcNAc-1-phosphate transferase
MIPVLVALLLSFGLALTLTPLARSIGLHYGWTSRPRPDRWGVTPRGKPLLGGLAMLAAFWVSLIVVAHALPGWGWKILFGGGAAFALIGAIDDRLEFRPSTKVFYQVLAALIPVFLGLRIPGVPPVLTEILAVAWIIVVVNAVNLLDNMDGLAAGVTAITAAFLAYHGYSTGQLPMLLAGCCLAGACLGFLFYNFPPSTTYMGDAGSHFLGYTLAVLCLLSLDVTRRTVAATFLVPVLVLLVPIFDTALVALTRFASGRSLTRGAADHSSHRLVSLGLSERGTALLTYILAILGGGLSIAAPRLSLGAVAVSVLFVAVGLYYFGTFLSRAPLYARDNDLPEAPAGRLALFDAFVPYKWATLDVLADSAVVIGSYTAAYLLRYEGELTPYNTALLERSLPILLACRLVSFRVFGLYRKVHEHLGFADVIETAKAIGASSGVFVFVLVVLYRFQDYSRAVLIIDAALTFGLVIGTRTSLGFFQDLFARNRTASAVKTLIVGAGAVGGALARVLRNDPDHPHAIVAYVDDDPRKIGRRMNGIPVWGPIAKLTVFLEEKAIDEVVITTSHLSAESKRAITEACGNSQIRIRRATLESTTAADYAP